VALSLSTFAPKEHDQHLIFQSKVEDTKLSILRKVAIYIPLNFLCKYKSHSHDHQRNSLKFHFRTSILKEDNIWRVTEKALIEENLREKKKMEIEMVLKMGSK